MRTALSGRTSCLFFSSRLRWQTACSWRTRRRSRSEGVRRRASMQSTPRRRTGRRRRSRRQRCAQMTLDTGQCSPRREDGVGSQVVVESRRCDASSVTSTSASHRRATASSSSTNKIILCDRYNVSLMYSTVCTILSYIPPDLEIITMPYPMRIYCGRRTDIHTMRVFPYCE